MSYVKREDVIGKKAITPDGNTFGTVKDIAFSTKGDVGLVLSTKDGPEMTVSIRQALAIGEFILLSATPTESAVSSPPPVPKSASQPVGPSVCPACGNQVKAGAKFCGKCGHQLT